MQKDYNLAAAEMLGEMILFAMKNKQVIGEKRDYCLTVEQIESFLKKHIVTPVKSAQ